jgi:hypothetical protein
MAPSAIETVTERGTEKSLPALKTTFVGAYTALSPVSYQKEIELGSGGAKVRSLFLEPIGSNY